MPPFVPNETMLKRHSDKGESEWEIYAWCVRDAMAKASGLKLCNRSIRERLLYENFMKGKVNQIEIDGKAFSANDNKVVEDPITETLL